MRRPTAQGANLRWLACANLAHAEPMPFKSQAQRRKFAQLLVERKISPATFEEWNRETGQHTPARTRAAKNHRVYEEALEACSTSQAQDH